MIHDHIFNAANYAFPNPLLGKGLAFLQSSEVAKLPTGRFEIDGDRLFALVQEYSTKLGKDCFWEAHRKFIDIQFVASGTEAIGYAPLSTLKIIEPYDAAKEMMKLSGNGSVLNFTAGMFAIFFPQDAHRPCMAAGGVVSPVRKIVVKVAADGASRH
jgi:YhcH/YjgK/YiaL family protein